MSVRAEPASVGAFLCGLPIITRGYASERLEPELEVGRQHGTLVRCSIRAPLRPP